MSGDSVSSTTSRRTRADIDAIKDSIRDLLEAERPMTCRQLFYRLVSAGVIGKTEGEYQRTVVRLTALMRKSGELPFGWITDNTRFMRRPRTNSSLADALADTARFYRRDIWDEQDAYVEIWLEKDALSGVLWPVTSEWHVPLMVTRGYASLSFLHSAAETIRFEEKPTFIYYFGDYDPSGLDIPVKVEAGIRDFAPEVDLTFERVAVTKDQIESYGLPTRPTKKTDSRAKRFEGQSVEVDAIPPDELRHLVASCITRHLDYKTLEATRRVEESERETLSIIADRFGESDEIGGDA